VMQLRREPLRDAALDMFEYDAEAAKREFPEVDHTKFVVVKVPQKLSQMRTVFRAKTPQRMAWVAGYGAVIEGYHWYAKTCYKMLRPVVDMYRSTGEHVKMIPVGRNGHYILGPVALDKEGGDPPTVACKQILNAKEDVYCVSSEYGTAVFEGQVTGNCAEIVEYNDTNHISVCVLASLSVDEFVRPDGTYDFEDLHTATKLAVRNCNRAIDIMNYVRPEMERANKKDRPIGVGVMGLHTMLQKMNLAFTEDDGKTPCFKSREHCSFVHETMYHAALEATCDLADEEGPHASFLQSMSARGKLHFDLKKRQNGLQRMYDDWDALRVRASKGRRNSLLLAMMPTASTSLIRGKSEGRNPIQSNVFKSQIISGEFPVVNLLLEPYLKERGLWTPELRKRILDNEGSVRGLGLPKHVECVFATAWEIPQKVVLTFAGDAQDYVDQSMSTNAHLAVPTLKKIKQIIKFSHEQELKTGIYYLRSRPVKDGINISKKSAAPAAATPVENDGMGCASGACSL